MFEIFKAVKYFSDGGIIEAVSSYEEGGKVIDGDKIIGNVRFEGDTEAITLPEDVTKALFGDVAPEVDLNLKNEALKDTTLDGTEIKAPDPVDVENEKIGDTTLTGVTDTNEPKANEVEVKLEEIQTDNTDPNCETTEFKKGGSMSVFNRMIANIRKVIAKAKESKVLKDGERFTKEKFHEISNKIHEMGNGAEWKEALADTDKIITSKLK